jgi:3-dehydrosphinganine reductase
MIVKHRMKGCRLIFVSSVLGYISFIGYASYAPAKHALKGNIILYCSLRYE